jgi:hypothetical protein
MSIRQQTLTFSTACCSSPCTFMQQMLTSATRSRIRRRSSMRSPLSAYFMDVLSSVTQRSTVSVHTGCRYQRCCRCNAICGCACRQADQPGEQQRLQAETHRRI